VAAWELCTSRITNRALVGGFESHGAFPITRKRERDFCVEGRHGCIQCNTSAIVLRLRHRRDPNATDDQRWTGRGETLGQRSQEAANMRRRRRWMRILQSLMGWKLPTLTPGRCCHRAIKPNNCFVDADGSCEGWRFRFVDHGADVTCPPVPDLAQTTN